MPKVSVIVPVYKAEEHLGECIDSILAQTFTNWECILVDDGSPDRSGEICDEYAQKDARIKVIHKPNGGVTSARSTGVEQASAEWIMFVDADDLLEVGAIEGLMRYLDEDTTLQIIEGTYCWFYPDNTEKQRNCVVRTLGDWSSLHKEYAYSLWSEDHGSRGPWAKIILKRLIDDTNALELPKWMTNREDTMMLTILATRLENYKLVNVPVYRYRNQFGSTAISNKLSWKYWADYMQYLKENVLSKVEDGWPEVYDATCLDVFKILVQGHVKLTKLPAFVQTDMVPSLNRQRHKLPLSGKVFLSVLNMPKVLRIPLFYSLLVMLNVKWSLMHQRNAIKSRKNRL